MYAPASCRVSVRRPRIHPSRVSGVGDLDVPGGPGRRAQHLFFARPTPLDRAAGLHGQHGGDGLGDGVELAPEAAAHGAADELELAGGQAQVPAGDLHGVVQGLAGGVDRHPAVVARPPIWPKPARPAPARWRPGGRCPRRSRRPGRTPRPRRPCAPDAEAGPGSRSRRCRPGPPGPGRGPRPGARRGTPGAPRRRPRWPGRRPAPRASDSAATTAMSWPT